MPRNVEIKARLLDAAKVAAKARVLSESEGTTLEQNDTFFKVAQGRLKLREFPDAPGKLIFYQRADTSGPKLSTFTIAKAESPSELKAVLTQALGVIGCVKKRRQLFMVGQTRVHIDSVKELGDFVELEVVLNEGQTVSEGEAIARDLMAQLGIQQDSLVTGAYMDLILSHTD